METIQPYGLTKEEEAEIRELLFDLPRSLQYKVLCLVMFIRWRSTLRLPTDTQPGQNRLTLVKMLLIGAWEYLAAKFRLAFLDE